MISKKELETEKKYLNGVVDTLDSALEVLNNGLYQSEKELHEISQFISNAFYEMDAQEKAVQRNLLEKLQLDFIALSDQKNLMERQKQSAYFGRVDFQANDEKSPNAYYIGISHILKENVAIPLVLDWRAPLSSVYYDYELGNAKYMAPDGEIKGKIFLKRQYKTKVRELVYAFDSDLTIGDEILKQTLGGNANSKMKNIVATIQTEQNKIIRADESKNLVVQGVAGSGKTSIALHRIAYLLYKNKISSKDILIISPSSLFSNYISDVLPELGEQNTPKITFDEIAHNELHGFVHFEPKSQMLEALLLGDKKRADEVNYKGSFEFFENLKVYLNKIVSFSFKPKEVKLGTGIIKAEEIEKLYNENYSSKAPAVRLEWIADYIVDKLAVSKQTEKSMYARVKKVLFNMFENTNILEIYEQFLNAIGLPFRKIQTDKTNAFIGYEDMPAILYIKDYLIGVETEKHYKHIVIDEMQDYSPIAFALICKIFPANKTILGDIYQSFEKSLNHEYLAKLTKQIGNTKLVKLATTYRSTMQIAKFNQEIINLQNVNNFNREGEPVEIIKRSPKSFEKLLETLTELAQKYEKIAILTPTIKDSQEFFATLNSKIDEIKNNEKPAKPTEKSTKKAKTKNASNILLNLKSANQIALIDETSGENNATISVIPTIYSKGLEFDAVVFVENSKISKSIQYNNTKYIACTRALHKLIVKNG